MHFWRDHEHLAYPVCGRGTLLSTSAALAQNGNMMGGAWGGGWMGGYGGIWMPILLVAVVVVIVMLFRRK